MSSWLLWVPSPMHPCTVSLQQGKRVALKQGRGLSNNDDVSALCYRRKMEKPLPNSLGWTVWRLEPAEGISCNLGQGPLSKKVCEMNKHIQLEEELRISRCSFCLHPAGCPGLPSSPWGTPRPGMATAVVCDPLRASTPGGNVGYCL